MRERHTLSIIFLSPDYTDYLSRSISLMRGLLGDESEMNHVMIALDTDAYDITTEGIQYYDLSDKETLYDISPRILDEIELTIDEYELEHCTKLIESDINSGRKLDPHHFLDYALGSDDVYLCTNWVIHAANLSEIDSAKIFTPFELYKELIVWGATSSHTTNPVPHAIPATTSVSTWTDTNSVSHADGTNEETD